MPGLPSRTLLLGLVSLSIALAGCTLPGGDNPPVDLGTPLDNAGAEALIDQAAAASLTGKHGFAMKAEKPVGTVVADITSGTDTATETTLMTIKGKPEFFSDPDDEESTQPTGIYTSGFTVYATKTGSVMHANKTAYAFSSEGTGTGPNQDPADDVADGFGSKEVLDQLKNGTVKSTKLVAHKGKAAVEVVVDTKDDDNQPMTLTVVLYRDPARVARVTGLNPGDKDKPNDPWKGATMTMDFLYDAEVSIAPSEAIMRASGLAYKSQDTFSGSGPKKTWTFQVSGGIVLTEVEVHAKNPPADSGGSGGSGGQMQEPDKLPNLWTMKLSDKTKTQSGTTVTFTDKDNDGKVSKGDTLVIESTGSGSPPMIVLFDSKTGTYVLPAGGLVAALAALCVAGFVLRRRG